MKVKRVVETSEIEEEGDDSAVASSRSVFVHSGIRTWISLVADPVPVPMQWSLPPDIMMS